LEKEVRELLHTAQQARQEAMDRGRVDTIFQVGDQVLLRTRELLDAAEIGKLSPHPEERAGRAAPHAAGRGPRRRQQKESSSERVSRKDVKMESMFEFDCTMFT
jgi:hypothetical protein